MSPWTDDKVAELRRLDAEGLSNAEMAAILGPEFSDKAVTGKRARLGLTKTGAKLKASMGRGARMTAAKWRGRPRGGKPKAQRVGGQLSGQFNPPLPQLADGGSVTGSDDRDLIAEFLARKSITVCPGMPAWGAVVPEYIGRKAA